MAGRFLARGERLLCVPAMGAAYVPRGSITRGLWRQYLDYGEYRAKTAERHPHTSAIAAAAPALVLDVAIALAGPRRLRSAARCGVGCYVAALHGLQSPALAMRGHALTRCWSRACWRTMHFGHGVGFIRGVARNGPPLAAARPVSARRSRAPAASPVRPPLRGRRVQSVAVDARRNAAKPSALGAKRVLTHVGDRTVDN